MNKGVIVLIAGLILWIGGLIVTGATDSDVGLYLALVGFPMFLYGVYLRARIKAQKEMLNQDDE